MSLKRKLNIKKEMLRAKLQEEAGGMFQNFLQQLVSECEAEIEHLNQNVFIGNGGQEPDIALPEANVFSMIRLPEEIVEMIFEEIKDSKSLFSCWRTCSSMHRILEPKKHIWMLHKVLPILSAFINQRDILKCRLVCQVWKSQIDHFLHYVFVKKRSSRNPIPTNLENQLGLGPIQPREPQPHGGTIQDYHSQTYCIITFANNTKTYFNREGQLVKHVNIQRSYIIKFKESLTRSPNLTRLVVQVGDNTVVPFNMTCDEVREILTPAPKLSNLNSLKLEYVPKCLAKVLSQNYFQHLLYLEVTSLDYDGLDNSVLTAGLDHLISFTIHVDRRWNNLSPLRLLRCRRLKELLIFINIPRIEFLEVLRVLQQFSDTLEKIRVKFGHPAYGRRTICSTEGMLQISTDLILHNVKTLVIEGSYDSLNYLLRIPKLEELILMWNWVSLFDRHLIMNMREHEIVEGYGFLHTMQKSNIWALFPFLNTVSCYYKAVGNRSRTRTYNRKYKRVAYVL